MIGKISGSTRYQLLLVAVLLAMIIGLSFLSPFFLSWKNCLNIVNQSTLPLILSVGMTFVICSSGIDLSIGATMAFSAVVMAFSMKAGMSAAVAILLGLGCGFFIGIVNGLLISKAKINAFIVTLSMMSILRGATVLITDGRPVYGFDRAFTMWGSADWGTVSPPVIMAFVITLGAAVLLDRTKFGVYCLSMGSNEKALYRSGINIGLYKTMIYGLMGLCAAIAGLMVTARLNTADPLAGSGYEMDAIAAVILGGTLMKGGRGSITGTLIACLILNVMKNGLTMLSISSNYQQLLTGVIVLVSVIFSEIRMRKSEVSGE